MANGTKLPAAGAAEEVVWRVAIGPRTDFYLARWRTMAEKGSKLSWNWAACLLSVFWFAWRRMPGHAALFGAIMVVFAAIGALDPDWLRPSLFASVAVGFGTGSYGNHFYRERTARLVATTAGMEAEPRLAELSRRGGVSMPALIAAIVLFAAAMVGVSMALAPMPALPAS
ncbi:MAG: DUF2628 domain-containing protein [Sphingosinicella sp.]